MTFRGIANDIWQLISSSVYVLYNFAVYKCDQESLYVTIYLGYLLSAIYSKLPPVCLAKLSRPVSDHTNLACKLAGHRLRVGTVENHENTEAVFFVFFVSCRVFRVFLQLPCFAVFFCNFVGLLTVLHSFGALVSTHWSMHLSVRISRTII